MISKTIANIAKRSRSIVINQSDMIPSEHNKRIDEMRKNNELYLSLRHSENFSKDTYLGIMKGELVASGHSSNRVSMALIESKLTF